MPRRQPRWPSIGFVSCNATARWRIAATLLPVGRAISPNSASVLGRNSWSGGSNRRIVTGKPFMIWKISAKSSRWIGNSSASPGTPSGFVLGHDHPAHRADAIGLEEHVLSAAQPDAFSAEASCHACVGHGLGIGADLHVADGVRPAHQRREILRRLWLDRWYCADYHLAGRPVDRDDLARL